MKNPFLILLFSSLFILSCEDIIPLRTNATLEIINETSCDFNIIMFNTTIEISRSNSIDSIEIDLNGELQRNKVQFVVEPRDSCTAHSFEYIYGLYEFDLENGEKHVMLIN